MKRLLRRLARHLTPGQWALTGSIAIDVWMRDAGGPPVRRTVTDVDVVATRLESIGRTIAGEFLVSHYHVPRPEAPKFMVQLVDPSARLRIDIFPDLVSSIATAVERTILGVRVPVLTAESILDHKLQTLSRASAVRPAAAKHYQDAVALAVLCCREAPRVADGYQVAEEVYSAEIGPPCDRCAASHDPAFPLAPKETILNLLGYV